MRLVLSLAAFLALVVPPPNSLFAKEAKKTEREQIIKVVELPDMVIKPSAGDMDIAIVREKIDVRERIGSLRRILVIGVKEGSMYAKCGIKPGLELVSIQGLEFSGTDYTKEMIINMLDRNEVFTEHFEFQVCPVKIERRMEGGWDSARLVRTGPVETTRVPIPERLRTPASK